MRHGLRASAPATRAFPRARRAATAVALLMAVSLLAPLVGPAPPLDLSDPPRSADEPACMVESIDVARAEAWNTSGAARLYRGQRQAVSLNEQTVTSVLSIADRLTPRPTTEELTDRTVTTIEVCAFFSTVTRSWLVVGVRLTETRNVTLDPRTAFAAFAITKGDAPLGLGDVATIRSSDRMEVFHRQKLSYFPDRGLLTSILAGIGEDENGATQNESSGAKP